jgi:NodT family efflux transporter outer membrane factor (OMF) lipoprotein
MNPGKFCRRLTPGLIGALLCGCAVGPDYVRPKLETPSAYKESVGWKPATPLDEAPRGRWWAVYGDAGLDALMDELHAANQTVKQAEAQYRAARALVQAARAAYFPTVNADASLTRAQAGAARSSATATPGATTSTDAVSLDASWEPDLWGKLRRAAENAGENARASAADLAAARLSAEAELAQDYFQLRITDEEKRLYDANVTGLEKSLKITQNQYAVGVAAQADVAQAQTQLKSTQAAAIDLAITRGQLEHAIAVLCGRAASEFSIAPAPLVVKVPNVPLGLPSDLLQRRPDVAAGERLVAAANANIGVAKAAYFPDLTLAGAYGYQGSSWSGLISVANKVWSVGPQLALNLFDAGARRAATRQAIANYDASVAAYRGTVLAAFQDVEDNLVALRVLADEIQVQDEATKAADQAQTIAVNQYKSGIVSYLNVVVAQTTALSNERASLSVRGRQLAASVALIKALGGGWDQSPTPTP